MWTQPICRSCYVAWLLGREESPHREPVEVVLVQEPCLICGTETGIFIRVDPKLTEGLKYAREHEGGIDEWNAAR
jgi:hypothetical protein